MVTDLSLIMSNQILGIWLIESSRVIAEVLDTYKLNNQLELVIHGS